MNYEERVYFDALSKDRAESANTLEKPSLRGVQTSVVEKYSDQAHFIYELLQNADDTHATTARFILEPKRLIFAHNGTRHFSVSDPSKEAEDAQTGKLGDINAITSIANSNKSEASIGKFGVGFKAVFQYTSTPHIYDRRFQFLIERFIVPKLLDKDFPGRRSNETLFEFPFDHPEKSSAKAYKEISHKLRNLSFPLLFLSNLKRITFVIDKTEGLYSKVIEKTYSFNDINAEQISLERNDGKKRHSDTLWLFSGVDDSQLTYSVGFFLDKNGRLRPETVPTFCFFPTKETTGLNFIIHAPFLLNDSREGIRAGESHNVRMIRLLANLAARAIICLKEIGERESIRLIDDNILNIIPYDPSILGNSSDKDSVSFRPFYESIKTVFQKKEILPSNNGYVSSKNAYWADSIELTKLFSNEQLAVICDNDSAHWVFTTKNRRGVLSGNKALCMFIDSVVRTNLNNDAIINGRQRQIGYSAWHELGYDYSDYYWNNQEKQEIVEHIKGITTSFIESQSISWLHEFYKWLSGLKKTHETISKKPFFLSHEGKAVSAYDETGQPILFIPVENISGFQYVHPALLDNPETSKFLRDEIKIKTPTQRDQIYNSVLPLYKNGGKIDTNIHLSHFKLFFGYYCNKCINGEDRNFVDRISNYNILRYHDASDSQYLYGRASDMYLPTPFLKTYFESKPETRFIAKKEYLDLIGNSKEEQLISFLTALGIRKEITVIPVTIDGYNSERHDLPHPYTKYETYWTEYILDGCKENLKSITENHDKSKSILLWNCLLQVIKNNGSLSTLLTGVCSYFYRKDRTENFLSSDTILLRSTPWLINLDGEFVTAHGLSKSNLLGEYNTTSKEALDLLAFLGITDDDYSNLTDSQREDIELARLIKNAAKDSGVSQERLLQIVTKTIENEKKRLSSDQTKNTIQSNESTPCNSTTNYHKKDYNDLIEEIPEGSYISRQNKDYNISSTIDRQRVHQNKTIPSVEPFDVIEIEGETDQDEYLPRTVDYEQRIRRANQRIETAIDKSVQLSELQSYATNQPKYTYGWFKALLELESLSSDESNSNVKKVSISFAKVERAPDTQRTLLLKHPSRYIPQFIEDFTDISLVLHTANGQKSVVIEAASVQSYTLRVKLRSSAEIRGLDLNSVTEAKIDVKSPAFILEELRNKFSEFNYTDDFDMRANLCKNIEFVFGPPGTGKTTYLAKNTLIPLMEENKDCKVLVLTPTNKSADVLVRKIMEAMDNNRAYEEWLIRFGGTVDEVIEKSPIFKERTFDIQALRKNVTVTTIARFPYDHFMKNGSRIDLNELEWDFVVIDEASMIPIANIIYVLYKKTPQKFIIAGDPFQIEPIVSVDLWKNENIYKLVSLDSFENPNTVPHQYKVELLTTQYRSVPEIGNVFSAFAYDGILKHHRSSESRKPLNLGGDLTIKPLNIVKFPVSKYESIYRAKRLQHSSSYQIYSALFTYEFVSHLAKSIARANHGRSFKIGVISPYRAQADLIDKLLASETMPLEVDVQVGTIHGFQGDECDIIVAVFNPPPMISKSKEMFLNKLNIINVSISRARDYLIVVMPDDATENINDLGLVKHIEQLIKKSNAWNETFTHDLESLMFGNPNYLEDNAFSTSHQSVNVYGLPEKLYEVRTEDYAVDIQIHRETQKNRSLS